MYSPTEERLRGFIERTSEAITKETKVVVAPGDSWAAYPSLTPKRITFKLSDVAVMLRQMPERILAVTGHEIAHLLYTTSVDPRKDIRWDCGKHPRAAHLLINVVEDSRIERCFSDDFPGARSLFDHMQEDVYDGKVQRGFAELPVKWRYILNIDRVLHGLEPWGDKVDIEAVEKALDHCLRAVWSQTTLGLANRLELPFRIMIELMKNEKRASMGKPPIHLEIPPELLGLPSDYEANAPQDDPEESGDQQMNGQQQGGQGLGGNEGDVSDGAGLSGQSGAGAESKQGKGKKTGGSGAGGFGEDGDLDGDKAPDGDEITKPTNIIEEMVNEEKAQGSKNKTIDILSYRQRQRARQAKEIEKQMKLEREEFWKELAGVMQRSNADAAFQERMRQNVKTYDADRGQLIIEINTLRGYARSVLRDNSTQRFAGNHTSGRKIKTHRLSRLYSGDLRLMERKEQTGGKSYAIAVVVDQSSSMRGAGKQELAYKAALVFLEAFDELVDTSVIGFSEVGYHDADARATVAALRRSAGTVADQLLQSLSFRTYKELTSDLIRRKATVPELRRSFNSTPMEAGVEAAVDQLKTSDKQVRAIVVITDGQPNHPEVATKAFVKAKQAGIEVYGLHIGGRHRIDDPHASNVVGGLAFLCGVCDNAVDVPGPHAIPGAVYRVLRGVVRNRRVAV